MSEHDAPYTLWSTADVCTWCGDMPVYRATLKHPMPPASGPSRWDELRCERHRYSAHAPSYVATLEPVPPQSRR